MVAYADRTDLVTYGLPAAALGAITTAQQDAELEAASRQIDSYFRARYPNIADVLTWDVQVRRVCCQIAAWNILNIRGYNPASGADVNVKLRYEDATAWLVRVERQAAHPLLTFSPVDTLAGKDAPYVLSAKLEGWIPRRGTQ